MRAFRNSGDGTFSDISERSHQLSNSAVSIPQSFNNDGWLDIFVMRRVGCRCATRLTTVTVPSPTLHPQAAFVDPTHSAWSDFDNDSWLDVFVSHEHAEPTLPETKGTAHSRIQQRALTEPRSRGVPGETTTTGMPTSTSQTMERTTSFTITGVTARSKVATQLGVSGAFRFWDYDNDGRLDLFVASYYFANGSGTALPRAAKAG